MIRISGDKSTQTRKMICGGSKSPEKTFGTAINGSPDPAGSFATLPRSTGSAPEYGSLKRRKTLRSASLGSLLQNRDEPGEAWPGNPDQNPANPAALNPVNPLTAFRSSGSSSPLTFTSSVKVQYKTLLPISVSVFTSGTLTF
jgi:hypothetical protein